jgi:hypothetical protein
MSINIPLNCEDSSENSNVLLGNQGEQQDQGLQQNEDFKTSNDVIKGNQILVLLLYEDSFYCFIEGFLIYFGIFKF